MARPGTARIRSTTVLYLLHAFVHNAPKSKEAHACMQASVALAGALDLGRILVFDGPDSNVYLSDEYCKDARAFDQCYFLPLSNCSAGVRLPTIPSSRCGWWLLLMKAQLK